MAKKKGGKGQKVQPVQQRKPQSPKKQKKLVGSASLYKRALIDPFVGQQARVPDMYAAPTTAFSVSGVWTLKSDASGVLDCILLPHPVYQCLSSYGSIANGATWELLNSNVDTTFGMGAVSRTEFAGRCAQWRIVSCGYKVTATSNFTATTGVIRAGTVTREGFLPVKATLGGVTSAEGTNPSVGGWLWSNGIPCAGNKVNPAGVRNLPVHWNSTLAAASLSEVTIVPKMISPRAFNFKYADDNYTGFDAVSQAAGTTIWSGDASFYAADGFETVVITGEGLPASTNVLSVECIYNLEAVSIIGSSTISNADSVQSPVSQNELWSALEAAARNPTFRKIGQEALSYAARSVTGLLLG